LSRGHFGSRTDLELLRATSLIIQNAVLLPKILHEASPPQKPFRPRNQQKVHRSQIFLKKNISPKKRGTLLCFDFARFIFRKVN